VILSGVTSVSLRDAGGAFFDTIGFSVRHRRPIAHHSKRSPWQPRGALADVAGEFHFVACRDYDRR
jgi:hypothetical protein